LHFGAFGYLTLRGLFSQPEMAALRDEVTSALTDAFGQLGTEPDQTGGISGDYLPLAVDRAPFSQSLIADDERTSSHRPSCSAARWCEPGSSG
jgi:hypothetical protein